MTKRRVLRWEIAEERTIQEMISNEYVSKGDELVERRSKKREENTEKKENIGGKRRDKV